jgi:hypothetical protein
MSPRSLPANHRILFIGPDSIPALYGPIGTLAAAGEVGQKVQAILFVFKDLVAAHARNPPKIKTPAEIMLVDFSWILFH